MSEFFKGWRRKIGVVTLVMACLFAGSWLRSLFILDTVIIPIGTGSTLEFSSNSQSFLFAINRKKIFGNSTSFRHRTDVVFPSNNWIFYWGNYAVAQSDLVAFKPQRFVLDFGPQVCTIDSFQVPCWSVVLPLTLLSAWLLLTKPRKSNQNKSTNPIPAEGK